MIEVELPDGTIVEFPAGTPQDVMQTALRRRFASEAPVEAAPPPAEPAPLPITQAVMPRDRQQRMTTGVPLAQVMLPPGAVAPEPYIDENQALMDAFLPGPTPYDAPQEAPPDPSTWGGDIAAGMAGLRNVGRGIAATPDVLNFLAPQNYARDIEGIAGDVAGLESQIAGMDPNDPQAQTLAGIMAALEGVSAGRQADLASPEMAARTADAQAGLIERMPAMVADEIYASQQPVNPAAQRIIDSGDAESTAREIVQAFASDPGGVLRTFGLRALPASSPSMLAAVAGQLAGGPGGAAALSGLVGGGTEFAASLQQGITDAARDAGVDLTDQAAIEAWITGNPDALDGIVQTAMARAGIISATEAAGGGIAGRVARTTARGGTGARVAGAAAGVPIEGTTEAAGEAAAMQATEGEIDPGEVAAGFFGGAALGAPQAGGQIAAEVIRGRQEQARSRTIAELMTQLEQAGVPDAADVAQGAASTGIEPYVPGQPRQAAPEQPATPPETPAQRVEPAPAPVAAPAPQEDTTGLVAAFGSMAAAMSQGYVDMLLDRHMRGETTDAAGSQSPALALAREISRRGVEIDASIMREIAIAADAAMAAAPENRRAAMLDALERFAPTQEAPVAPEPAQAEPPTAQQAARPERRNTVFTPDDEPIEVEYQVVEADELISSFDEGFQGDVQPRSRDENANSELQIERIANAPNFGRLNRAPETDRGAPVVGPDGMVESGNGRVTGLRRAYQRGSAAQYRAALEAEYPEAAGMRNPIVVARRITDVDRADFAYRSNKPATMAMSATEDARAEARMIDGEILGLYRGGDIMTAANRPMLRAFIGKLPAAERNRMITPEGGLTADGARRVQAAMFSRAYGNDRLLARMAEAMDDDMRSVTTALTEAAPRIAQMRDQMERGLIAKDGDFVPALVEAVEQVANFRARGEDLAAFRAQIDAFAEPLSDDVQDIMSALFNEKGTRLASKAAVADFIQRATEAAMKQDTSTGTMAGIEAPPARPAKEIIRAARTEEPAPEQTALFDGTPDRGGSPDRGRQSPRRAADGGGREADGESLADRPTRVGRRPKAGLSPEFMDFSFTNKASVYSHAFRAAGLDPDKAVNLPIEEQLQAVKKAVETTFGITVEIPVRTFQSKNRFGRKVEKTKTDTTMREAADQLLNAYRNLQMLAHVMAMPEKAIGLPVNGKGITLSLVSKGSLRGALGMYSYTKQGEQRVITLPGMSNSFAHEWAHALDHYMALQADQPMLQGLLTRGMASAGVQPPLSPKRHLTDAFAHIIWAMYGDGMKIGALRLQLQVQSAQVGPDGKFTPAAKNAQKILTDMREGRLPPANLLSTYFKTSQQYGQLAGDERYYTNPAEMFARAFEALTAKQVEAVSDLPQAFLTKGTWAYQDSDDTRAALTFPKGIDLQQFAVAIGNLQQAMSRISLHGLDAPAKAPATHDTLGTRDLLKVDRRQGTVSSEMAAAVENLNTLRNLPAVMKSTTASFAEKTGELYSQAVRTGAATLFAIAARQTTPEAKAAVTNIALAVGKQPGAGRRTEGIWEENVRRAHGTRLNKVEGATIKAAKAMGKRALSQEDLRTLRSLLTGEVKSATPALEGLAKDLRQILNDIWYDLKNAGVEVGYASNYLPHIYDADLAQKDPAGFRKAAGNVYRLLFDREVMDNDDPDTQMKDINAIINGLRNTTEATPKGGRAPAPRLTEADEDMIETFRAARKRLRDLERSQAKSPDPDKFVDRIQEAAEATEAAKADMLEMLRDRWSDYSAERWQIRQGVGMINDFGAIGPTANFLKGRVLPNEAGALMKEFMQENPIDMIMTYSLQAQRRSEYAKIFGADNSKLKNMLEVASKAGTTKSDINMIKMGINAATGRMNPSGSGVAHLATTAFTLGNMSLLGFAALSSMAESATTGLRTGQVRDSLRSVATNIAMLVRKKRRGELMELGRTIGLILPYAQDSLMQNRLGMDVLSNRSGLQNLTGRFFILNGLTPLTHYQRAMTMPVANAVMLRLLRSDVRGKRGIYGSVRDKIDGTEGAYANKELNELGIGKEQRESLLDWLESLDGGMPRADDLFGPDGQSMHKAGELWSRAIYRFSTETIQDPLKTDRTFMANHPDWSAMYGIMSFIDSFTRNVIWRSLERGLNDGDGKMKTAAKVTANAALMATPMIGLIAAQVLIGIVREAIVNTDKMREIDEDEDEDLAEWLIKRGMFRSGMFGRLDWLANLAYGVRYDTDLASMRAGPYLAHFMRQVQSIISAEVADNSANTNTAEVRALEAAYRLFAQPAITAGLSAMSYGRASIWAGRAALAYTSRYPAANEFSEWMLGETGSRHVGAPPWWETGGNDQTPLTTRFLIRPALEAIRGQ